VVVSKKLNGEEFFTVIVTKSKAASELFLEGGAREKTTRIWANDPRLKPLNVVGFSKKFMKDAYDMLDRLRSNEIADVAFLEDDKGGNLLTGHTVHLDIDPERDYGPHSGDQDDTKASDAKHRNLLRQELLRLGARSSRGCKRMTKKQRMEIARSEGHEKKKEEQEKKEEKPASPKILDGRQPPHSGLAAAIAAEERRAAAANADADAGSGGRAASGDGSGDVQKPEHGTGGGNGESAQGAGERETAASDTAEHLA
jgi:hypothetical protein